MKPKSLKLFIKQKKLLTDELSARLTQQLQELEALEKMRTAKLDTIQAIRQEAFQTVTEHRIARAYIHQIKQELASLEEKIEAKEHLVEETKRELSQIHAQKRALEKLLENEYRQRDKRRSEEENRMAHESFLRKIAHHH